MLTGFTSMLLMHCRTKIKTRLETAYGELVERIPAWITWATQVSLDGCKYAGFKVVRGLRAAPCCMVLLAVKPCLQQLLLAPMLELLHK